MSDLQRQYALEKFLGHWPRMRMATMTLDEYAQGGFKDDFTCWIERS